MQSCPTLPISLRIIRADSVALLNWLSDEEILKVRSRASKVRDFLRELWMLLQEYEFRRPQAAHIPQKKVSQQSPHLNPV